MTFKLKISLHSLVLIKLRNLQTDFINTSLKAAKKMRKGYFDPLEAFAEFVWFFSSTTSHISRKKNCFGLVVKDIELLAVPESFMMLSRRRKSNRPTCDWFTLVRFSSNGNFYAIFQPWKSSRESFDRKACLDFSLSRNREA